MRYLANRPMTVTLPRSEERRVFKPGDTIPDFLAWPHSAQRTLLETHQVVLDLDPDAWVRKDDADGLVAALDALGPKARPKLPQPKADVADPAEDADAAQPDAGEDGAPAGASIPCELCSKSFASERAVKTHRTKIHGGM